MSACTNCGAELADSASRCGVCSLPRSAGSLARITTAADRVTDEIMAAAMSRPLLAREEVLGSLILDAEAVAPLQLSELGGGLARLDEQAPTLGEIESLLTLAAPETSIGGIVLGDLFDRGGQYAEILRRGITFLKKKRFDLAREWWALQRSEVEKTKPKLELLFLLMELYTATLAEDPRAIRDLTARIRNHPLFHEVRRSK